MKVAQLVKVWINLSYRYFTPYSPDRTNCNALYLLLRANTEDCFFYLSWGAIRQKLGLNFCHCNDASSECGVWQSIHAGRQRYTAVDTCDLVLWWSQQRKCSWRWSEHAVSPGGLIDGTKGCVAVFGRVDRGDSGQRFLKSVMDSLGSMIQVVLRSQHPRLCFTDKKSLAWTNFCLAHFSIEGWARTIGDYRLHHRSLYTSSWFGRSLFNKPQIIFVDVSRLEHYQGFHPRNIYTFGPKPLK